MTNRLMMMGVLALAGCLDAGSYTEGNPGAEDGWPRIEAGAGLSADGAVSCDWDAHRRPPRCPVGTEPTYWRQDLSRRDAGTCWADDPLWRDCENCGWQWIACEPPAAKHRPEEYRCTGNPADFAAPYSLPPNMVLDGGPLARIDFARGNGAGIWQGSSARWISIKARLSALRPIQIEASCEWNRYAELMRVTNIETGLSEVRCFAGSDGRRLDCETREDWTEAHGRQCTKLGVGSVDCETGEALN